jgi:protein-S-isoprenylcysteine O-methyltransferase Ste14
MKYSSLNRGFPAGNPIANVFVVIVGTLVIAAAVVLGFFAFIVLASIVLVLGAVISLRVWWLNRKLARAATEPGARPRATQTRVIEGEYHVVKSDEKP